MTPEEKSGLEELAAGVIPGHQDKEPKVYTPGSLFAERYEIQALVGQGALGSVYRVFDRETQTVVGLKLLRLHLFHSGASHKRFERFTSLAQDLSHPNLVQVITHGTWQDEDYIVREFVDGQSLDKLIMERKERQPRQPTFGFEEVINILIEVSLALKAVENKTFHGSLTPNNIIITDDAVKITDLAMARIFQPAQFSSLQIYYGNGYYYLAPEYDRSGSKIDQRADLYAAAVIAYEMLTGDIPRTPLVAPSVANAKLSPGIDGPFVKALDLDPQNRQESLSQFVEQLCALTGLASHLQEKLVGVTPKVAAAPAMPALIDMTPAAPMVAAPTLTLEPLPTTDSAAAEKAKSRLAQAIERQLVAHGSVPAAPVQKTPVLPSASAGSAAATPRKNRPALYQDPVPPSTARRWAQQWPWMLAAVAIVFAGVMWAELLVNRGNLSNSQSPGIAEAPKHEPVEVGTKVTVKRASPAHREIAPRLLNAEAPRAAAPKSPPAPPKAPPPSQPAPPSHPANAAKTTVAAAITTTGLSATTTPHCPAGMVFIPGGNFSYGSQASDRDFLELSMHRTAIAGFCIDVFEWPNKRGEKPKSNVTYNQALTACANVSKRLCSEVEWERACKGSKEQTYPYGDSFTADACNTKDRIGSPRGVAASGAYARCRNTWGIYDMSGNTAEWTSGILGAGKTDRMVRGGSSKSSDWAARCTYRKNRLPSSPSDDVGFRCCALPD